MTRLRSSERGTSQHSSHHQRLLRAASSLLPDPHHAASRRLAICALVISAIQVVCLMIYSLMPLLGGPRFGQEISALEFFLLGTLLLSLAVFFLARSNRLGSQRTLDIGLLYMIAIAAVVGVGLQLGSDFLRMPKFGVSEICVLVVFFPVIVPNTPLRTFLAALVAVSMDPLGVVLAGGPARFGMSLTDLAETYHWSYICAGLAVVPSFVLTRLQHDVIEAGEMGSYRLVELLGSGGMGEVWRAKHRMLVRPAAVKFIRPDIFAGEDESSQSVILQRFEQEAQATAGLRSPHTIVIYDFGLADDGTFYHVMELLDGFDLQSLVDRIGPLPPERSVHLLRQVCHSLGEAHESGLIHRDIKPANIFTCRYGRELDFVKVLDFGLVKSRQKEFADSQQLTAAGVISGTPSFMAPEQIMGDRPVDARADIYALGCVAYWLLTGQVVFAGETAMQTMVQHVQLPPVPPSERVELPIPAPLETIVLACLEKDPDQRPQSMDALSEMLAGCNQETQWTPARARQWWDAHRPA